MCSLCPKVGKTLVLAMIAVPLIGCASTAQRYQPFSDAWADHKENQEAFEARKRRLRGQDELVLVGEGGKSRAAVVMDEEGKARLNVGRKTGWSADLNYDDGPEAKIKYKVKWDRSRPGKTGR